MSDAAIQTLRREALSDPDKMEKYVVAMARMGVTISPPDKIPAELDDYGWEEAFEYAESPSPCEPLTEIDTSGFSRENVMRVISAQEGQNDGEDWKCVVELWDGRFARLEAGCDYTGWD